MSTRSSLDSATGFAAKASDTIESATEKANAMASEVADRGREAGRQLDKVAGNLKGAVDKSLSDQPMATLAVAAMVGFVAGALWKS